MDNVRITESPRAAPRGHFPRFFWGAVALIVLGAMGLATFVVVYSIRSDISHVAATEDISPTMGISVPSVPTEVSAGLDEPIVSSDPIVQEAESVPIQEPAVASAVSVEEACIPVGKPWIEGGPDPCVEPPFQFLQMRAEWGTPFVGRSGVDVPSRGEEPLSGTLFIGSANGWSVSGSTTERIEWFRQNLPVIDPSGKALTAIADGNIVFAVVNKSLSSTSQLFLTRDLGPSWLKTIWLELNMPDDWNKHVVSEIRVRANANGTISLLLSFSGEQWWPVTID